MPKTITQTALAIAPTIEPVATVPAPAGLPPTEERRRIRSRGKGKSGGRGRSERGAKTGRRFSPASRFRG